jgi:hypothetical protein
MTAISIRRGGWWSRVAHVVHHTPKAQSQQKPLCGKDFGALPVCGSVRPLASQRARAAAQD